MPWTRDRVALKPALGQRRALMRARVFNGKDLIPTPEERYVFTRELNHLAFAFA
jgi:hypothetical protein